MEGRGATLEPGATGPTSPAFGMLPALASLAALVAYGFLAAFPAPDRPPVPLAAPYAAAAFALVQILLPRTRPSQVHLLSPLNWALLAFFLQLVVLPLTIAGVGPEYGALSVLPSQDAINQSIVISIGAFAAFSAGYALLARPSGALASANGWTPPPLLPILFAGIGLTGLLLRFGSLGEVTALLADPAQLSQSGVEQEGTLTGAASTFLRPFLLNAIVMAWCLWLDRRGAAASRPVRLTLTAVTVIGVVVVGATYGFNRAAFMVPIVAMAAAYSAQVRRLSVATLAVIGLVFGGLGVVLGGYRAGEATAQDLARDSSARQSVFVLDDLQSQVQLYGNAPQFTAFLLETVELHGEEFTPKALLGSLMSPVPLLGKGFRDYSGVVIYNRLIYGDSETVDQIIPFEAEAYLALGPIGLLAAFLLVGLIVARLQRGFEAGQTSFDRYAVQLTSMWVAFLVQGSLAAVSQVFVFFLWPIYAYAFLRREAARRRARSGDAAASAGDPFRDGQTMAPRA